MFALQHLRNLQDGISLGGRRYFRSFVDLFERSRIGDRGRELRLLRDGRRDFSDALRRRFRSWRSAPSSLRRLRASVVHGNDVVVPLLRHGPSSAAGTPDEPVTADRQFFVTLKGNSRLSGCQLVSKTSEHPAAIFDRSLPPLSS